MINWKELTSVEQWNDFLDQSEQNPLFVFKHSTTCPISAEALREFNQYLHEDPQRDVTYVLVKVIESRPVSNQIATDVEVKHESPQAIIIHHKQALWNASHWKITTKSIKEAMQTAF